MRFILILLFASIVSTGCGVSKAPLEIRQMSGHNVRAWELYKQGQYTDALREVNKGLEIKLEDPISYNYNEYYHLRVTRAHINLASGNYDGLESELTDLLESTDDKPSIITMLARTQSKQKEPGIAVELLMPLVGPNPKIQKPYRDAYGEQFFGKGAYNPALRTLSYNQDQQRIADVLAEILDDNPGSIDALKLLVVMKANGHRSEKAEQIIKKQMNETDYSREAVEQAINFLLN